MPYVIVCGANNEDAVRATEYGSSCEPTSANLSDPTAKAMAMQQIGVIFDMDGVLVDSARAHLLSWQRLAQAEGCEVSHEQFKETFGRPNEDIVPRLFGPQSDGGVAALANRKEAIYRDLIRSDPPIVVGAVHLVRELCEAGVRLAIGSSAPRENIDLVLRAMDVVEKFSVVVSGDDVTRGKPDPEVFLTAATRLGLRPEDCVVIEDAPVGVQAARAAGTRTVAILMHHSTAAFDSADLIVPNLADLTVDTLLRL